MAKRPLLLSSIISHDKHKTSVVVTNLIKICNGKNLFHLQWLTCAVEKVQFSIIKIQFSAKKFNLVQNKFSLLPKMLKLVPKKLKIEPKKLKN